MDINKVEVRCGGGPHWQEGSLTDLRYSDALEALVTLSDT